MLLSQIDESNRPDHARLNDSDECYYIYEYTSGRNFAFSATNGLISNLKKKPSSPANLIRYKNEAISKCAEAFSSVLNPRWLDQATIVPVPGSKAVGDPEFDNRMERVARAIKSGIDVRNLVRQRKSTTAAHEAGVGERVTLQELVDLYEIDESLSTPAPKAIGILDDVLTAGTHFKAMKAVLSQRFPDAKIIGLFVARRVFANPDPFA